MEEIDEEDYVLLPEQQRPFTSGVRRKRVKFVRSSDLDTTTTPASSTTSGASIADTYLSIVMKQSKSKTSPSTPTPREQPPSPRTTHSAPPPTEAAFPPPAEETKARPEAEQTSNPYPVNNCEICNLPLTNQTDQPHEASLAHQVCLTHSHPPSHLDRTRQGMRYLSTYGWDPDSRRGLGAPGREGIREPLKPRPKNDTAGLGTGLDADGDPLPPRLPPPPKVQKMNAKQSAKKTAADRARGERMRRLLFSNDEVVKYLGEEA
ncbi:hypothetical protein PENANT_c007G00488 [Penicillium antarcticum]|uniref:G-patch domain-containing protein n=1 Tax=Penicillium antarcticum TaxID=416450 RepID=A0A1V6QCR2_9EURO|nr:uncharacterized protein N7508_003663 [Penicillium antarcticum]KAJ5312833.1 hypothetical protein N7508_003663 [Penicillium antarcticum]OQD86822.1 hypothetical protein PENANT_c007G00488 [Penicillium antarcticum]